MQLIAIPMLSPKQEDRCGGRAPVAPHLLVPVGRAPGDPDVALFLNALRGHGMRRLLSEAPAELDVDAVARRLGLTPAPASADTP